MSGEMNSPLRRRRVAIVGTQGVPNAYGGFETLAEYLVKHLGGEFDLTVYCSSTDQKSAPREYLGAKLVHIPLSSHGAIGMVYDSISLCRAIFAHDAIVFLGFGAGLAVPFLPGLKAKMILNFGGLDWKRDKWSVRARQMIRLCEKWLVGSARTVVADNELIAEYVRSEYRIDPVLIAYGGDQAQRLPATPELVRDYPFLEGKYALALARIQPDNNIDMILEGFPDNIGYPLVFIGNWKGSEYGRAVRLKYSGRAHLILLDAIYDRGILDAIRSNCTVYIHGHSAGGTNPSLCEAMYLGLPIVAFASGYNEETLEGGVSFDSADSLRTLLSTEEGVARWDGDGPRVKEVAERKYRWSKVAAGYADLLRAI